MCLNLKRESYTVLKVKPGTVEKYHQYTYFEPTRPTVDKFRLTAPHLCMITFRDSHIFTLTESIKHVTEQMVLPGGALACCS